MDKDNSVHEENDQYLGAQNVIEAPRRGNRDNRQGRSNE